MISKTGSMLTKVAGIINIVFAVLILIIGSLAFIGLGYYQEVPYNLLIMVLIVFLIILIIGIILLKISNQMKNSKTVKKAGIWAIVLGILTISNVSGILALIGGIIALTDADKKSK